MSNKPAPKAWSKPLSYSSVAQNNPSSSAAASTQAQASAPAAASAASATGAKQIEQYVRSMNNSDRYSHRKAIHSLLGNFAGKQVTVEFNDGNIVKGIWHAASAFYEATSTKEVILKGAELIQTGSKPKEFTPGSTLVFEYSSVASVTATILENNRKGAMREFKTDSATKQRDMSHLQGRELQGLSMEWLDPRANVSLDAGDHREWDQFAVNEQRFGVKSTYDENIYTKPLDKGSISAESLARAEKIAALIEADASDNVHLREERGQAMEQDLSEEAMYSGVIREDYQGSASTKEKWETTGTWKRNIPTAKPNAWERGKPKIISQGDTGSTAAAPAVVTSTGGRGGAGGRGANREANTRERRNPPATQQQQQQAAHPAPVEAVHSKVQQPLGIDTATAVASAASNAASPPPGLAPTPPKPTKVVEQNNNQNISKNAQNVASDAAADAPSTQKKDIIPQMPELIPTDCLTESGAHAMKVANSVLLDTIVNEAPVSEPIIKTHENKDNKEKESEQATKSSLNPNASSFTFNVNAKEFVAPQPVATVPVSVAVAPYAVPPIATGMMPPYPPIPQVIYMQQPSVPTMVDAQQQQPMPQQQVPVQGQSPAQQPQAPPQQQQQQQQPMMNQSPANMGMVPPTQQPQVQQVAPQQVAPQQAQMMYDPTTGMPVPMMGYYPAPATVGYPGYVAPQQPQAYPPYQYVPTAGGYVMPQYYSAVPTGYDPVQMQQYQQQMYAAQYAQMYTQQQMPAQGGQYGDYPQQFYYGDPAVMNGGIGGMNKQMGGRGNNMGRGGGRGGGRYNNNDRNNTGRSPRTGNYGGGYSNNYNRHNNGGYSNNSNNSGNNSTGQGTPALAGVAGSDTATSTNMAPALGNDGANEAAGATDGQLPPPAAAQTEQS